MHVPEGRFRRFRIEDGILTISVPKAAKKQLPKQTSINIL